MEGKELFLKAFEETELPRPPWMPLLGGHVAALLGKSAGEFFNCPNVAFEGLSKACSIYRPDAITINYNLQMEAGAIGAPLKWSDTIAPSITSHMFEFNWDGLEKLPESINETEGVEIIYKTLSKMRERFRESLGLCVTVSGPLTLAYHLRGKAIATDLQERSPKFLNLLAACIKIQKSLATSYARVNADMVAVVEPFISLIAEKDYNEIIAPAINEIFDAIKKESIHSALFQCGNAKSNLQGYCGSHCDAVFVGNSIGLASMRETALSFGKTFAGNLNPISTLLLGDENHVRQQTDKAIKEGGKRKFILATGCDLAYATPPDNLELVGKIVRSL